MIKIMFVCLGNICRSPMAECVMKDMLKKRGLEERFFVNSAATSSEEEGHDIYYRAKCKLKEMGVDIVKHHATLLQAEDFEKYDFFVGMEERNICDMQCILGSSDKRKIFRLLDYSDNPRDIADPWYTGNFDATYREIVEGCESLLRYITSLENIS